MPAFKKLSIIIPAFNEAPTLAEIVERVKAVDVSPLAKEIIVVDNNSTDETYQIAKSIPDIVVIKEHQTQGKGAAVKAGLNYASGDIVLIQDADLEYEPQDFPLLLTLITSGKARAVIGVRTRPKGERSSIFYRLGNTAITLATNWLYGGRAAEYTGGYKVFTKDVLTGIKVRTNDFAYEHELVCKILKSGHQIYDVPIRYIPRDERAGKKINWKDGFRILFAVIKYRFVD